MFTDDSGQRTAAEVPAREHYLECMMSVGSNAMRFDGLNDNLLNSYLLVGYMYPKTREDFFGLLKNYKGPKKQHQHEKWGVQEELSFVQNNEEEKRVNIMEGTTFHVCNKEGHWGDECPTLLPAEQA